MDDLVFRGFLQKQFEEGMGLARQSDLLELVPVSGDTPRKYIARFRCKGLVRNADGVAEHSDFHVGIHFLDDYLRRVEPFQLLTWLLPPNAWHPNINAPAICIGKVTPGTSLVDLLYRLFEVITYQKVTPREDDALNRVACQWARRNRDRFPIDRRPLKRRSLKLRVEPAETET